MGQVENRGFGVTKVFQSPIVLMWDVWTNRDHISNWWGPDGFTTTIHKMDFREGGEWNLTLHGPDGTNYPNKSVFKEILHGKKIVFEHFNPHFVTTVLFESSGHETVINWSMLFDTAEMRDIVIKAHKADDGLKQNLDKLQRYLSEISSN